MSDTGRLPADTTVGPVSLRVGDIEQALAFYGDTLGFRVVERSAATATLAATPDEPVLIHLEGRPGVRHRAEGTPGLYHFAVLFPDRRDLGRTLLRLFEMRVPFQGFADHGISEAAYLADPDGNGIELAADRPRVQWERQGEEIAMVTQVLNVTGLLRAIDGDPWIGQPAGTRIGHIHLHVADLAAARHFYSDVLGFDVTNSRLPGAVFLASGGYHHHIAVNTWTRQPRPADEESVAGMIEFVLRVPDPAAREALSARLAAAGSPLEGNGASFVTCDPDRNRIRIT